ncbi:MAG: Re/Si-specific NAD(P)(+) transhydrogenase subunit alpha [Pseudomonadota bacterium]|nr:Re/Si-specific NAD(P)(+) transhydrogenase subunit alpha [Pseudomonadota bacterium]
MKVGVPKERREGESRVAVSPDSIKKLIQLGFDVSVETGAGENASFSDDSFYSAGATIAENAETVLGDADLVLKVRAPMSAANDEDEISKIKPAAMVIAHMSALSEPDDVRVMAAAGLTGFAMDLMPRITRAQSMDVLSSQSNLAGYKAVLDAASELGRAFPMMMTAAGTIAPAKVFIMGVGVAGLQAIATAKRLGAVVTATDVRPVTKEQVESLGGKFLEVDADMENEAQTEGGYAKEMPPEYFEKQKAVVAEHIKKQDVVITTALIPGRPAPVLVDNTMVDSMLYGSVIVDLATEEGGNCSLSEAGKVVKVGGVTIIGHTNVAGRLAEDASSLFAKNLINFLTPLVDAETKVMNIDWNDEIIQGTLVCKDGKVVHPALSQGE